MSAAADEAAPIAWKELESSAVRAFAAKDYDRAVHLLSQAIELKPDRYVLYSNRSAAYARAGDFAAAERDARTALGLRPRSAPALFRLGAALFSQERHEEGWAAFADGLAIKPGDVHARSMLLACEEALVRQVRPNAASAPPPRITRPIRRDLVGKRPWSESGARRRRGS